MGSKTSVVTIFVGVLALVGWAQTKQGIARDEVVYMHHGERYAAWWEQFTAGADNATSREEITEVFGGPGATDGNREHPPLMKTLFGASKRLFADRLGWVSEVSAYRLPTAAMSALLIVLVFLFVRRRWGGAEALLAAGFMLLLPRAFFHGGLATFDGPIVTLWFATLVCYSRALESGRWFLGLGVTFGLALATKHNALLLPVALLAHWALWVFCRPKAAYYTWWQRLRSWRIELWIGVAVIAPLLLFALWPWLWLDPIAHSKEWLLFHLHHVHYNFEYLGTNYNAPPFPWHVPVVTTALTVPAVTLVAGGFGFYRLVRMRGQVSDARSTWPGLLLFLAAGVAMGPFLLGTTPIFGAEKHWAAAMPSLCIFAGIGGVWAARLAVERAIDMGWLRKHQETWRRGLVALVTALLLAAAATETVSAQPYALSHYNALAGGGAGGADLGMNRQFWGVAARGVLSWLNQQVKGRESVRVYTHDASPAWPMYRRAGLVRSELVDSGHEEAGIASSDVALVIHEKHFLRHDLLVWHHYRSVKPAFVLTFRGVPLVSVYLRESAGDL